MNKIELHKGNCLEVMKSIPDGSVDMILTDPPYGTTACKWDSVIDLTLMWEQLKRIIKPNGAIVMTASQPFTTMLIHSNIKYFPQMVQKKLLVIEKNCSNGEAFRGARVKRLHDNKGLGYPKNLLKLSNADQTGRVHPTQKPVALMEYLIKTYTNEGETVLDFTMGSGTTGVACCNLSRSFIGIELSEEYFKIAEQRIQSAYNK